MDSEHTKGIIVFRSKHGSTRQFAEWISESMGFPALELPINSGAILKAETVVIGSSIKIGRLVLGGWIRRHWKWLRSKRVVLFITSGTNRSDVKAILDAVSASLPEDIFQSCAIFPVGGKFNIKHLGFLPSLILKSAAKSGNNPAAEKMMEPKEDIDRANIEPLVQFLKGSAEETGSSE